MLEDKDVWRGILLLSYSVGSTFVVNIDSKVSVELVFLVTVTLILLMTSITSGVGDVSVDGIDIFNGRIFLIRISNIGWTKMNLEVVRMYASSLFIIFGWLFEVTRSPISLVSTWNRCLIEDLMLSSYKRRDVCSWSRWRYTFARSLWRSMMMPAWSASTLRSFEI